MIWMIVTNDPTHVVRTVGSVWSFQFLRPDVWRSRSVWTFLIWGVFRIWRQTEDMVTWLSAPFHRHCVDDLPGCWTRVLELKLLCSERADCAATLSKEVLLEVEASLPAVTQPEEAIRPENMFAVPEGQTLKQTVFKRWRQRTSCWQQVCVWVRVFVCVLPVHQVNRVHVSDTEDQLMR